MKGMCTYVGGPPANGICSACGAVGPNFYNGTLPFKPSVAQKFEDALRQIVREEIEKVMEALK